MPHILVEKVVIPGLSQPVGAVFDGGAEVCMLSYETYLSIDADFRPPLRPSSEQVRGVFSDSHTPIGEITLQVTIPSLKVVVEYDFLVDHTGSDEPMIIDNSFMVYAGIDNLYESSSLRRGKHTIQVTRRVSRHPTCRRITLSMTRTIAPGSRVLVPGRVRDQRSLSLEDQTWLVEPPRSYTEERPVMVARSLCSVLQMKREVPVEVFNPTDEPVVLYKDTTLGVLSPANIEKNTRPLPSEKDPDSQFTVRKVGLSTTSVKLSEELENMVAQSKEVLSDEQLCHLRQVVHDYQDIFATKDAAMGRTDVVLHDIDTGNAEPIKGKPRRTPLGLRDEAMKEEQKMKDMGVIEPSESPWASPVVLVRKKDQSLRYCIDYRRLNNVTVKDSYPLPNIQDCLDSLSGAKYFSSMDLSSGYWQVGLTEQAKDKTSFYGIGGGLWRFKVMPFGLCNAPATFERLMERVLSQLQWQICLCYLDDILVYSGDVNTHLARLSTIFDRLRAAGLRLKPKKCHFFQESVTFLGHVISREGIATDPDKIRKVVECPAPTNLHEVRSLVGFLSYYRRFIPQFSEIARPLIHLTEKNVPFVWGSEQEESLRQLKHLLTRAPVLAYPLIGSPFILDTDASGVGIGAVLSQIQGGEERVIAFGSRSLSKAERNYCAARRELWAVIYFTEHYKHFLMGARFTLRTDNMCVRFWQTAKSVDEPVGQIARWLAKLAQYDFEVVHRAGRHHGNADGLPRPPFVQEREPFADCDQCHTRHRGGLKKKSRKVLCTRCQSEVVDTEEVERNRDPSLSWRHTYPGSERSDYQCCQGGTTAITTDPEGVGLLCPESGISDPKTPRKTHRHRVQSEEQKSLAREGSRMEEKVVREIPRKRLKRPRGAPKEKDTSWCQGGVDLDRELLREEQLKDPACVDALLWLQAGQRPSREEIMPLSADHKFLWGNLDAIEEEQGLLAQKIRPLICGAAQTHYYVPASLRRTVISKCHNAITAGHFYYWKTLHLVKRNFVWPGMTKDVQNYCKCCEICATRKKAGKKGRAGMRRYDAGLPLEEVCIDLAGPFPKSDKGNAWVLVVVDSFTKWMEAYPLTDSKAPQVAEALVLNFFSRFGVPYWIKSDRGRQFQSELFEHMCTMLDMQHKVSTPFHPQGNSRVERMVKVVSNLVNCFCQSQSNWDDRLPLLSLAYRSTIHEVTGYSPNYLMLGREVYLPLDVMIQSIPESQRVTAPQYVTELKERLQVAFKCVRDNLKREGLRQRKYYNLKTQGDEFKPGQLVYLKETTRKIGVSPKLSPYWLGPYMVVKKFGTVYEIQKSAKTSKLYHFDLLKPCFTEQVPSWIKREQQKLRTA